MMLLKKTVYDKLVAKVNSIDTSAFVLKTKYDTDKTELEKKIPDASGLDAKLSSLNRRITANKTKLLLAENELKKLKTFDSSCFRGKSDFEE